MPGPRSVPGFFMRTSRQQGVLAPHRIRSLLQRRNFSTRRDFYRTTEQSQRTKSLIDEGVICESWFIQRLRCRWLQYAGNSRKSQHDSKQRFMTITSQPPGTQRKPCNFAAPNDSRPVCSLPRLSCYLSVIAAIALFPPLFFFWQVRILRALLAGRPVFFLLFTVDEAASSPDERSDIRALFPHVARLR